MRFEVDDQSMPEVRDLLDEHRREIGGQPPADEPAADMTLWTVWDDDSLLECGGLRRLTELHGEITSMITRLDVRGRGVGAAVLAHLLYQARRRGYRRVSVRTGGDEVFAPARRLLVREGFQPGPPFAGHLDDPDAVFLTLSL